MMACVVYLSPVWGGLPLCRHLGCEPADGGCVLSLSPSLCLSNEYIHFYKKKKAKSQNMLNRN